MAQNSLPVPPSEHIVVLEAQPGPIPIDTTHTAVLVIDMQNDFGAKGGLCDRTGIDISGIQKVIAPISHVLVSARNAGVKIIYLKTMSSSIKCDLAAATTRTWMPY